MNTVAYAKSKLESEFGLMNTCAGGMNDAQYNWVPAGTTCNPASKSHIHALSAAEFFVIAGAKGDAMTWAPVAAAHGLPANPNEIWGYTGNIPMAAIMEYGAGVQKSVLDYVATLTDADFDREVDTKSMFGKRPVSFLLQLAGMHAVGHGGDIAAVKGMQGLKGLPF